MVQRSFLVIKCFVSSLWTLFLSIRVFLFADFDVFAIVFVFVDFVSGVRPVGTMLKHDKNKNKV